MSMLIMSSLSCNSALLLFCNFSLLMFVHTYSSLSCNSAPIVVIYHLLFLFLQLFSFTWDAQGTNNSEGVHSLGWAGQEEESWWKIEILVGIYQWVVSFMSCEWIVRDQPLFWITSLISGVTGC
jgi:hypothetical protein